MPYTVYILMCSDGSYYTGSANDLNRRLFEHQEGLSPTAYTFRRRPVKLIWSEEVETLDEALYHERQIKGWSHAKKAALVGGDFELFMRSFGPRESLGKQRNVIQHNSRLGGVTFNDRSLEK